MSPERQNIAIAEWCGWKKIDHGTTLDWLAPDNSGWRGDCPKYTTDLNALQKAWLRMTPRQHMAAIEHLERMLVGPCDTKLRVVAATAAQRAEALLRTIGKWEDDE